MSYCKKHPLFELIRNNLRIFLGSEPCNPKIVNCFTIDLGNWKSVNFLKFFQVMVFVFFTWSKSLDPMKNSFFNLGESNFNSTVQIHQLLTSYKSILHSIEEGTFFTEITTYFSGFSANSDLLLGLSQLGVNVMQCHNMARHCILWQVIIF